MLRLRENATAPGEKDQLVYEFLDPMLELIRLLREATEVEHALLVQYLYAAFSVKPQYEGIVGTGFPPTAPNLLGVAVQEMQHLHDVNRMLVALGASPNLVRQDFPYEPDIYPFAFNLEAMSDTSLAKYVWTEAPAGDAFLHELEPVLGPIPINHLGSLYATLVDLTEKLMADPGAAGMDLVPWRDRLLAIKGEGEMGHFAFFKDVYLGTHAGFGGRSGVWELAQDDPDYPALGLPVNPTPFIHLPGTIADPEAAAIAWLFDLHYWIVLALLDFGYRYASSTAMALSKRHMGGPLLLLGRHLATLGCGAPFDPLGTGYNLGVDRAASVRLLGRLLEETRLETEKLRPDLPANFPFAQLQQTISNLPQL